MAGYGPLPPVPNVIKVVVENQGNDGRTAANVFHQVYSGAPPAPSDCVSIAQTFWNEWVIFFTPTQPAQTSLTKVTVTDLSSDFGSVGEYDNGGTPVPGTSTHGMLPYHSCFLLSFPVQRRYRGGHPRAYLPIGTTNDLNDDGDWKDTSYPNWVTAWNNMQVAVQDNSPYGATNVSIQCAISYISKVDNPVYPYRRAHPLVYDIPNFTATGEQKLATQRRRVRRTARRR